MRLTLTTAMAAIAVAATAQAETLTLPQVSAEMAILRVLPPPEYDRPYDGTMELVYVKTQEEVRAACPPIAWVHALACSYHWHNRCKIVMAEDDVMTAAGLISWIVWRHEIAHCNGWPGDHPGARSWDEDTKNLSPGGAIGWVFSRLAYEVLSNLNRVPDLRSCLPDGVTNEQMVWVVIDYIDRPNRRQHKDLRDLAIAAIHEAWPCKDPR